MSRGTRLDLTSCLLWIGAGLLFFTIRTPYDAGNWLTTVEGDALAVSRILVEVAADLALATADGNDPAPVSVLAQVHQRCEQAGLPREVWPQPEPETGAAGLLLGNLDYLFLVARTPAVPGVADGLQPEPPEVWAWPRSASRGLSAVFCRTPTEALATRNVRRRYFGSGRIPEPGTWRPRNATRDDGYWGLDGNYWRPHPS